MVIDSAKTFFTGVIKKPPFIFPFIALGHVMWLLYTIWGVRSMPFPGIEWLAVLWMLCYTISWIAVCDLRRWGAITYVVLTLADQAIYIFMKTDYEKMLYASSLWMIDLLFCFFILFFYRRFK